MPADKASAFDIVRSPLAYAALVLQNDAALGTVATATAAPPEGAAFGWCVWEITRPLGLLTVTLSTLEAGAVAGAAVVRTSVGAGAGAGTVTATALPHAGSARGGS